MTNEKTDKKEWILTIAENLFAELGFDGTSTRLIAKEAGVNMAMLNYYFGGKEGLYLAVLEKRIQENHLKLQSINNENISSFEKLDRFIDSYVEKMLNNCGYQKIIYREMSLMQRSTVTNQITSMLSKNIIEVKKILTDGIANGSFADVDVEMLIASMFGTKIYLTNASPMASFLFNQNIDDNKIINEEIKIRLKNHLKRMFKLYLTKS